MAPRDRLASLALGGGLVAAASALALLSSTHRSPGIGTIALLVALYAVASRIDFEVGAGSAVPTVLVLVPMLFLLPLEQVPLWVAAASVLSALPEQIRRHDHPERLLIPLACSWYALGPTLVLVLVGERAPSWTLAPVYAAALLAQFGLDFAASALRDGFAHGVGLPTLTRYLAWVYLIDVLLAPVALGIALLAVAVPAAAALALPLIALLGIFARERSARIDHALELSSAYRGTGLLAETYHEILSEDTLDETLARIADTLSDVVPLDGIVLTEQSEAGERIVLLDRGVGSALPEHVLTMAFGSSESSHGELTAQRLPERPAFTDDERQVTRWFADAAALALDNARIRAGLKRQAQTDSLTGLLNHRVFHERLRTELAGVRAGQGTLALLLLDIDDFKRVNDVHGHAAGDQVLRSLSELLRSAVRDTDEVCRVGGEELAVIMPGDDGAGAVGLAQRLAGELARVEFEQVGSIGVSIGVAEGPLHATSARELVACAEGAMMSAKARGKNQIVLYEGASMVRPSLTNVSRRADDLRSIAHLKMLQSLAGKLNRLNDVRRIGETIVDELRTLIDYHSCRVYIADGNLLVPVAHRGELAYADETVEALTTNFGEGVTGTAAEQGRSLLVPDAERCEFAVQIPGTERVDESMVAVPLLYGSRAIGVVVVSKLGLDQFDHDDVRLLEVLAGHASVAIENARLYEAVRSEAASLERDFLSTVEALANALEANDAETSSHARAIGDLALETGRRLDLDDDALKRLELGALLHDIGKIGVPSEILTKRGPLTSEERRLIETHPELGERIIRPIERLADVRPIVRHCHERWDGAGYPDGLRGREIPLEARIILVVDAYHAMTSDRPYRERLPVAEACGRLREGAGRQFDPAVVAVFLNLLGASEGPLVLVA
jgi:diguanylate cyclase (GGDEF)-like protein